MPRARKDIKKPPLVRGLRFCGLSRSPGFAVVEIHEGRVDGFLLQDRRHVLVNLLALRARPLPSRTPLDEKRATAGSHAFAGQITSASHRACGASFGG